MTPEAAAARVVEHALSRPPTLGAGRLVCVDGPAGSGKTTLAEAMAARTAAHVVHLDDLFPGWGGLAEVPALMKRLLRPLARGEHGHWHRYDWYTARFAEWHTVRPGGLLVVEGVGSGGRAWADLVTTLAFVEAPRAARDRRGIERGGVGVTENWRRWSVQEDALFSREHTRHRADLLLSGR